MTAAVRAPVALPAHAARAARRARVFGPFYVAEHRLRAVRAWWKTLLLTTLGNPILYLVSLGVGLATLVPKGIDGVPYVVFVGPALLVTAAVTAGAEESGYPYMMGFKWNPIFYGMVASPISGPQIALGMALSISFRVIVVSVVYFVVLMLFGAIPLLASGWLLVPIGVLTGMAVSSVITVFTSAITEDRGQNALIMRFGVMPMFLFSGTFFPLTALPLWLRWIGWLSPVWHGTQLGRDVTYGSAEPIWLALVHVVYLGTLLTTGLLRTSRIVTDRLAA